MSIVNECLENDLIYIIDNFICCEYGKEFTFEDSVEFNVGQGVYYLDSFKNPDSIFSQDHTSWVIKFKTDEGKIYLATQLYFVTSDVWMGLEEYFKTKYDVDRKK